MPAGYTSISLPDALLDQVEEYLRDNRWGYRSKAEVISTAIREFLQREETKSGGWKRVPRPDAAAGEPEEEPPEFEPATKKGKVRR
ncbi:MAG TPA: hypothetical protein VNZ52_17035 [Candidatus Thermoplasmatota archaeon]|nr:hypothetical protein [Candidatus Thermoplasmatota archaeon]